MQNRLQNFIDKSFGEVRVLLENNEAWFMASDICRALGIKNPWDAVSRLDEDEKMTLGNAEGHSGKRGGAQSFNLVNESGMWKLVLRSRLPQADTLRRWLTHTVIPSIRKNGGYVEGQESLSGEDMQVLRSEIKRLQTQIDARDYRIASLEDENENLLSQLRANARAEYAKEFAEYICEDD